MNKLKSAAKNLWLNITCTFFKIAINIVFMCNKVLLPNKGKNEQRKELFIRLQEESPDNKLSSWALSKRYDRKSSEFNFFFAWLYFYAAFNCVFTFTMGGLPTWLLFCYPIAQYCFCNTAADLLELDKRVFKVDTMRLLITANKSISFFIVLYALARVIL